MGVSIEGELRMPYSSADVRARERILRALLIAPPKSGKTVAAVGTAPGPVFVLNTDGKGALDPVVYLHPHVVFEVEDITSSKSFDAALVYFKANANKFKTIVLDNITFFGDSIFSEVALEVGKDGRSLYPEFTRRLVSYIRKLTALKHHVIINAHARPGDTDAAAALGHLPSLPGQSASAIAGLVQDQLWLEASVDPETGAGKWEFLLAPQGKWTKAARSVQGIPRMKADFTRFLELANQGALPKVKAVAPVAAKPAVKTVVRPTVAVKPNATAPVKP